MSKEYDLTIGEASLRLGVADITIRRLIKKGELTKIYVKGKHGRSIRLSSKEIAQLISKSDKDAMISDQEISKDLTFAI